jgi:hypothetical protein
MSERKTININPELFKMGGNNTTKKQKKKIDSQNKIQIKEKKPKKISTIKRNILKMIRNQHLEKKKKHIEPINTDIEKTNDIRNDFKSDFNETLEYLSTLTKDTEDKKKNQTIKRYSQPLTEIKPRMENIEIPTDRNINNQPTIHLNPNPNPILLPPPKYGCLKNGTLPTYRNWINQTRKAIPTPTIEQQHYEKKLEEQIKDWSKIQQQNKLKATMIQNQTNRDKHQKQKHYKIPKQKRILRRTFYVGRSRVFPKVTVLVANKTIRANTQLKTQNLKQIPMTEVKNYLLKNGFIKIGTNAPNDILREMYENAQMMCGEIKNHNPENLLYNYFNDTSNIV